MANEKYIAEAKLCVRRVMNCPVPLSCGFLLTRGLAGGARCAGWSMPALTGSMLGSLSGAVLFAAACALYRIARRDLGERPAWLLQPVTAAIYILHCLCVSAASPTRVLHLPDSASVSTALLLTGRTRRLPLILPMLLITLCRLLPPVVASPELMLRLTALTGGISSAWMCGSAVCCLTEGGAPTDWRLLTIGAAAGMIQI